MLQAFGGGRASRKTPHEHGIFGALLQTCCRIGDTFRRKSRDRIVGSAVQRMLFTVSCRPHDRKDLARSVMQNDTMNDNTSRMVYWHRQLPPLEAELVAEHTVEANSSRVPGTIAHRDELWDRCYRELMANAESRLVQEIGRLGGDFAHVYDEAIDPKHDDAAGEAWLHGRFSYMLYRHPQESR